MPPQPQGPYGSNPAGPGQFGSTPLGGAPFNSAPFGSTPFGSTPIGSMGATPFGYTPIDNLSVEVPEPRRRSIVWLGIAILLLVGGIGALVYGILDTVRSGDKVVEDAVATGRVVALGGENTGGVPFTIVTAQTYSVYISLDTDSENERDYLVGATRCDAQFADGSTAHIEGQFQASSSTIGDISSIGYFSAPVGPARVLCYYSDRGFSSFRNELAKSPTFYVSPGKPNVFGSIFLIIGGAFAALLGVFAMIRYAKSGKRPPKPYMPLA